MKKNYYSLSCFFRITIRPLAVFLSDYDAKVLHFLDTDYLVCFFTFIFRIILHFL